MVSQNNQSLLNLITQRCRCGNIYSAKYVPRSDARKEDLLVVYETCAQTTDSRSLYAFLALNMILTDRETSTNHVIK